MTSDTLELSFIESDGSCDKDVDYIAKRIARIADERDRFKAVLDDTYSELGKVFSIMNSYASGDSQKEWCRVEAQGILGEVYFRLAQIFTNIQGKIT